MSKTYRAIRHDIIRLKQSSNDDSVHHPDEKINQIKKTLNGSDYDILELFAGNGNCTTIYHEYGHVTAVEKSKKVYKSLCEKTNGFEDIDLINTDSFVFFHGEIFFKRKYSVIDIDAYGFPNRFFPDVFLLIENGFMFITMPKPSVNILNGITAAHLISYYGEQNPSIDTIIERFALWGLCHWRKIEVLDVIDCKSIWRIALSVQKVKATEYTGVRNQPYIDGNSTCHQETLF